MAVVTPVTVREGRREQAASALSNQSLQLPGDWNKIQQSTNRGEFLLPVGTDWVSRDVMGVSEEVYRVTNGRCRVASCQCGRCLEKGHFPHVVVELGKFGATHPVFGFTSFGPHVVQRLRSIHVSQDPNKKSMDKNAKLLESKKRLAAEVQTHKLEVVHSALRSHKFDWRGPDGLRTKAY